MYHTASAYLDVGRLGLFVTEMYTAKPARLQPLTTIPVGAIRGRASRLSAYHSSRLDGHVAVKRSTIRNDIGSRMLGNRRYVGDRTETFGHTVARMALEAGWALHMPCSAAHDAFASCGQDRVPLVLEQYIAHRGYVADMMRQEAAQWGVPIDDASLARRGLVGRAAQRNEDELEFATRVVVGSDFAASTLRSRGVDSNKIVVAPYGVDTSHGSVEARPRAKADKLNVAFVGTDGLRKGLLYVLSAARAIGPRVLHVHVFGDPQLPTSLLRQYDGVATFYQHVPQRQLLNHLQRCHVGALPSLAEGSALSTYEIMAMGIPMIVTPNAGSVVRNNFDGVVVPARSTAAVERALESLLDDDWRLELGANAARTAQTFTWERYGATMRKGLGLGSA